MEKADDPDIWTIQKLLASPASDGGSSKIPTLKYKAGDAELEAKSNEEKGRTLAKSFFPPKPLPEPPAANASYPPQCSKAGKITSEAIARQIHKLKPYKAPGPDGIPNIVLTKCADLLVDRLYFIYTAIFNRRLYYAPWKAFNTIVTVGALISSRGCCLGRLLLVLALVFVVVISILVAHHRLYRQR